MFVNQAACIGYGTDAARNRALAQNAEQASLRQRANVAVMQPSLTGRERQIALRNPYRPLTAVGRVPGLNAWPRRRMRNPRYYGFGGLPAGTLSPVRIAPRVFNGFAGFGSLIDELPPPPAPPIYQPSSSGGTSRLSQILDAIRATLPATISAIKGQPYYDPNTQQQYGGGYPTQTRYATEGGTGTDIGARAGSAVGGLGDTIGAIVRDHPYATLAAGAGVILLFMKPPSRGRR